MFDRFYLTNYHVDQVKKFAAVFASAAAVVIILANFIYLFFGERAVLPDDAWENKRGYPFVLSGEKYVDFIENYPHYPGVELKIHTVSFGDTLWSIADKYSVSVDTIIAANQFLKSFTLERGERLVVPLEDGVLFPFRNYIQAKRMKFELESSQGVKGRYRPSVFRIYSKDDMRLVFFPGEKPVLVSETVDTLNGIKSMYQSPAGGRFSSMFGDRVDPFFHGTRFHNGIDIYNRTGTPIRPVREGVVFFKGWRDGYGYTVMVLHERGYSSLYAHCSKILVEPGDRVEKEDIIALMGSTGRSTGPHLHFSMFRHGEAINPISFIW